MTALPDPRRIAPLKAAPKSTAMDDWLVAYQTGNSGEDGEDWCIVTDNVRGSALMHLDLPSDARADAEAIVAIVNAYRAGQLVPRDSIISNTLADTINRKK